MKKSCIIAITSILVIIGICLCFNAFESKKTTTSKSVSSTPAVNINYNNIEKELSKNSVIKALPSDSKILIKFFHFEGDTRVIERTYIASEGSLKEGGLENSDLIINIASEYLNKMTTKNVCAVLTQARKNGDLGIELVASETSLAWKYKSIVRYRDCLEY